AQDVDAVGAAPDPLLVDLAERLWRLGLTVVPQYGVEGGVRIPLAIGHPDLPGELLVAVLTDDAAYVAEPNLRRRERHWVQRLASRGWRVHMAFSTAVFTDPQREAEAIVALALDVVDSRRRAADPVRPPAAALPLEVTDTDEDAAPQEPAAEAAEPSAGTPEAAGAPVAEVPTAADAPAVPGESADTEPADAEPTAEPA